MSTIYVGLTVDDFNVNNRDDDDMAKASDERPDVGEKVGGPTGRIGQNLGN